MCAFLSRKSTDIWKVPFCFRDSAVSKAYGQAPGSAKEIALTNRSRLTSSSKYCWLAYEIVRSYYRKHLVLPVLIVCTTSEVCPRFSGEPLNPLK